MSIITFKAYLKYLLPGLPKGLSFKALYQSSTLTQVRWPMASENLLGPVTFFNIFNESYAKIKI